jgi:hypothetical protein
MPNNLVKMLQLTIAFFLNTNIDNGILSPAINTTVYDFEKYLENNNIKDVSLLDQVLPILEDKQITIPEGILLGHLRNPKESHVICPYNTALLNGKRQEEEIDWDEAWKETVQNHYLRGRHHPQNPFFTKDIENSVEAIVDLWSSALRVSHDAHVAFFEVIPKWIRKNEHLHKINPIAFLYIIGFAHKFGISLNDHYVLHKVTELRKKMGKLDLDDIRNRYHNKDFSFLLLPIFDMYFKETTYHTQQVTNFMEMLNIHRNHDADKYTIPNIITYIYKWWM